MKTKLKLWTGWDWVRRLVRRFLAKQRERRIIRDCGCIAYCPKCKDPLNDQAYWLASNDEGLGTYGCGVCGNISEWHFGITPFLVLIYSSHAKLSHEEGGKEQQ